jgi:hypothetical protein
MIVMNPDHPMRERAVLLLAEGWGATHVGQELGVDRRTVHLWQRDPTVQADVARERAALLAESRERGKGALAKAMDTLVRNLDCGDPHAENRAAAELLDRFGVPKTTKVEQTIEAVPSIDELAERFREKQRQREAQGGQG